MLIPSDYKELLKTLNRYGVRYLVVGAYAVIHHTEPRYTKDLDIWVEPEIKNAGRLYEALKKFGAPLKDITVKDFTNENSVYQIGVEPIRIDFLMSQSGVKFSEAWKQKVTARFEGIQVNIIGINELIRAKEKTKRPMDEIDIRNLREKLKLGKQK